MNNFSYFTTVHFEVSFKTLSSYILEKHGDFEFFLEMPRFDSYHIILVENGSYESISFMFMLNTPSFFQNDNHLW